MTTEPDRDKRHVYGPRPVGALVPALIRPAFKRASPASARILADWEAIIGPTLARVTTPRRLAAGTLQIGCTGPIALELQHLSDQLVARINAHLGSAAVARIRLVREGHAPALVARPAASTAHSDAAVDAALAPIGAGPLRDSLSRLGRRVLART